MGGHGPPRVNAPPLCELPPLGEPPLEEAGAGWYDDCSAAVDGVEVVERGAEEANAGGVRRTWRRDSADRRAGVPVLARPDGSATAGASGGMLTTAKPTLL